MSDYTLMDQAGELAGLLRIQAEREYELAQITEQVEAARKDMFDAMVENGTKKVTHPLVTISRSQGKTTKVTNAANLVAAITERGLLHLLSPREVTKVEYDMAAAKKIGVREEMPGVEQEPYDRLVVRVKP